MEARPSVLLENLQSQTDYRESVFLDDPLVYVMVPLGRPVGLGKEWEISISRDGFGIQ